MLGFNDGRTKGFLNGGFVEITDGDDETAVRGLSDGFGRLSVGKVQLGGRNG
eukprot:CAMPEP_0170062814 /NCGR_PEP_ID=MMETSP0019_2-20121128/3905_1 /TAXON_ID=98059 /ORGANISM="Dinobryon sp., Strain UTEXLB2267" /LENGTH=51 /DNA_ID=CAMNT_0010269067 /DNA_START=847 /DNA_END=1002 /DNA_ORIENTATION=+